MAGTLICWVYNEFICSLSFFRLLLAMCTSKPNSSSSFRNLQPVKCYMCRSNPWSNGNSPSFFGNVLLLLWGLLWNSVVVVVSLQGPKKFTSLIIEALYFEKKKVLHLTAGLEKKTSDVTCRVLQIAGRCCGENAPFLQILYQAFFMWFIKSHKPMLAVVSWLCTGSA